MPLNMPSIDYKFWNGQWRQAWNKPVYTNVHIAKYSSFKGSTIECERLIKAIVTKKSVSDAEILCAIDLINQWGGRTSRLFYTKGKYDTIPRENIEQTEVLSVYKEGLRLAKDKNVESIEVFQSILGIGPSYSGKHAAFWSDLNLIIVDSKIAGALGFKTVSALLKQFQYETILEAFDVTAKKNRLNKPVDIERALFAFHNNYFSNDSSKLKLPPLLKSNKEQADILWQNFQ
jgi:hypothetical protein